MSDSVLKNVDDEVINSSNKANNAAQEVNNLCDFLKLEFQKYTQHKILFDTIQECLKSKSCKESLKAKVNSKVLSGSCSQCMNIDCNLAGTHGLLLGVQQNQEELNFTETVELRNLIAANLKLKYKEICNDFHKLTGKHIQNVVANIKDTPLLELTSDDKILLQYKQELTREQNQYMKNLLAQMDILEEISKLRLNVLPDITEQKVHEYQVKSQMNLLRSQIAQEKVRVDIFTETNKSLDAYKQLIKDIREQQEECQREIENLSDLKQKYEAVSCKQFDDILQSFIQFKFSIEKKKLMYECLHS